MKVYVSVKQAGKRKDYITKKELVLESVPSTLREFIAQIVRINVNEYNHKAVEPLIIKYLSNEDIESQAEIGKVDFGELRQDTKADVKKAIETAILAFEDGIYRVFISEDEVSFLDEPLSIKEGDVLTFIRFTMLAGRIW